MEIENLSHRLNVSPTKLKIFRVFAFITLVIHYSLTFIANGWGALSISAVFLTLWGLIISTIVFGLLVFKPVGLVPSYQHSKIFHTALILEFIITVVFWGILFRYVPRREGLKLYMEITYHVVPLALLLIEFVFGSIVLVKESIVPVILLLGVFGLWNSFLALVCDIIVYKPFTWLNALSYVGFVAITGMTVGLWKLTLHVQKFKFARGGDIEPMIC